MRLDGDRPDRCRGAARPDAASGRADGFTIAQLDTFEREVLNIARRFFEAFARPESHAWMDAFREAEQAFPAPFGASIAHAVLIAINELRASRRSVFQFERSGSASGARVLTDGERYFICVLHHIRRGNWASARAHALFLCEGNDASRLLAASERLAIITGDVSDLRFNSPPASAGRIACR